MAEEIGREQLTLWKMACGKSTGNTDDLIGVVFDARVGLEKNSERRKIVTYFRGGNQLRFPTRPAEPAGWTDAVQEKREDEAKRKAAEAAPSRDIDDDIPDI